MRNRNWRPSVRVLAAGVATAGFVAVLVRGAAPPSLEERVRVLRAGTEAGSTDPAGFQRQAETLEEWGTRLLERTGFTPHNMNSSLIRLRRTTFNPDKPRQAQDWTRILGFIEDNYGKKL